MDRRVYKVGCGECGNTGDFEVPRGSIVHFDETARRIVYFAICPNGHKVDIYDEERVVADPDVREEVARIIGSLPLAEEV